MGFFSTLSCGLRSNRTPFPSRLPLCYLGRAAKDLADLLVQEASAESGKHARGGSDRTAAIAGGGTGTKARSKKKRPKKKRANGGSGGVVAGVGIGGTGSASSVVACDPGARTHPAVVGGASHVAPGRLAGGVVLRDGVGAIGEEAKANRSASVDGYSSDSSSEGAVVGGALGKQKRSEGLLDRGRRVIDGGVGGAGGRQGEGDGGDESMDDEEEQRGVVKKLRWRTEVGRMG